jgi:hypothetical protein
LVIDEDVVPLLVRIVVHFDFRRIGHTSIMPG